MKAVKALYVLEASVAAVVDVEPTLEQLKVAVGGWLEGVSGADADWHAYCDEEGKLKGKSPNVAATRLARSLGWPIGDVIVGDVIFLGNGSDGQEADVPATVLDRARLLGMIE